MFKPLVLFAFSAAVIALASVERVQQHVGPPLPPSGSVTYSLPNESGFLEFSWTVRDTGEEKRFLNTSMICWNFCEGQKHFAHSQCDLSCDRRCTKLHAATLEPQLGVDLWGSTELGRQLAADARKFGSAPFGEVGTVQDAVDRATNNALNDARYKLDIRSGCWNTAPCSGSDRYFSTRRYEVVLRWQFYRMTPRPDGTQSRVQGPQRQINSEACIPIDKPLTERTYILCSCDIVRREPEGGTGVIPGGTTGTTGGTTGTTGGTGGTGTKTPTEAGSAWSPGTQLRIGYIGSSYQQGQPIDRKFLEQVGFNVQCPDLTTCLVSAKNPTDKPIKFTICAGTLFVCIPGQGEGAQDTILVQDLHFNLPALSTQQLWLSLSPSQIQRVKPRDPNEPTKMPLEGRVLCMDIDKRPPTSNDKFGVALPPSRELWAIAQKTMAQPFQGPWDQARMWLVKDAATLDHINDRMNPPATEGMYLKAIQEANEWGGTDFLDPRYRKCLRPQYVLSVEAGTKALRYYAKTLGTLDGPGLASFIQGHLADFAAKHTDARSQDHADRIAALAMGLLESKDADCAKTALDLLLKGSPEAGLKKLASMRVFDALTQLLLSTADADVAASALDTVQTLKLKNTAIGCLNMSPKLPKELRDRGKALAKSLFTSG